MSSKSRGRRSGKARNSGKAGRPREAQQGPPPPKALFRDMVRSARELLAVRNPLDAELFVSDVLGTWWGQQLPDGDVEEVIGEALVDHAARSDDPAALALLTGIAWLGTPGQARKAGAAAERLAASGVRPPPWADHLGRVTYDECWVSHDVYGDQHSIICTFSQEDVPEGEEEVHALVALVDYNVGGMAKDAWCTSKVDRLLDHCRQEAADNPLMQFESQDPAVARARLEVALQQTDRATNPPVSSSFPAYHAFVRTRLEVLPEGGTLPQTPRFSADQRAALAVEFLASPEAENLSDSTAAGRCADIIIDYGCADDLGRPVRVSPIKVEQFLLDWLPRKVMLRAEDREAMPHVLAAWVRWSGRKTDLPQPGITQTLDAVWEASRRFEDTYGDPSRLGLDSGTVDRLVPDGNLEALPRRAFAVPLLTGEHAGIDLGALDPADPDDRQVFVAAEHPEYASAATSAMSTDTPGSTHTPGSADATGPGSTTSTGASATMGADGGVDSAMHLTLHEIVATQLWDGDPPETWETARRLLDLGYERHDVLHMLMTAVSRMIYGSLREGQPYDPEAFRSALAELPEWWEHL